MSLENSGFEFRKVSKFYGKEKALKEITVSFQQGINTAILGTSGSGKTTLLHILAGLLPPSSGEVVSGNEETIISKSNKVVVAPHKRNLGMVFQDLGLWPNMTVMENILMPLSCQDFSRQIKNDYASQALNLCSISTLGSRKPGEISGGQQQRVAIARAIVAQPAFLLFDEPFSGLDLLTKTKLMDKINSLSSSLKMTIILVTHDPFEAMYTCQRLIVLKDGEIEEKGNLNSLMKSPQSDILKLFLDQYSKIADGKIQDFP
jgi:iron(III) transport system ATP-binding protein